MPSNEELRRAVSEALTAIEDNRVDEALQILLNAEQSTPSQRDGLTDSIRHERDRDHPTVGLEDDPVEWGGWKVEEADINDVEAPSDEAATDAPQPPPRWTAPKDGPNTQAASTTARTAQPAPPSANPTRNNTAPVATIR